MVNEPRAAAFSRARRGLTSAYTAQGRFDRGSLRAAFGLAVPSPSESLGYFQAIRPHLLHALAHSKDEASAKPSAASVVTVEIDACSSHGIRHAPEHVEVSGNPGQPQSPAH